MNFHVSLDVLNIITLSPPVCLIFYYAFLFLSHLFLMLFFFFAAARVKIPLNSLT